jgi:uncharacterized RDD family membrane protein YckC
METRGIVTPEGVELDFEIAGLASRVLARLLDLVVYVAVAVALYAVAVWAVFDSETAAVVTGIVLGFVVLFVVPIAVETAWRGRTVGKAAVGLRAVTTEGGPSGFRHAAIRSTIALVELYATSGILATAVVLFSAQNQRLGDMAAGVIVVRERLVGARAAFEAPAAVVTGAGWASLEGFDVRGLGSETLQLARQVLRRAEALGLDGRAQLAGRVATLVEEEIGRARPAGLTAEAFLAAVVGEATRSGSARAARLAPSATPSSGPVRVRPPAGLGPAPAEAPGDGQGPGRDVFVPPP